MELFAAKKSCETCGSPVDFDMPSGFCPGCLLNTVLETETESAGGSRIDDYELLSEVARGGMGIVYRARQHAPSRVVALKMILPAHVGSLGAVNRFRAEAEAAASLDHEAILPIYAVGEHDGAPFYSMKFAEGGTLSARIVDYRDKPREGAALVAKLAHAVAYAHKHGILHRDLKPGNVLFDVADKPYVSDFGLAKWLQRECDLTQTLAILGTPYYMAPEQAKDSRAVTAAADIYSLGAILYHLLEGHPPVGGDTPMEVLHRANTQTPRLANRCVPRDLEVICLKCLEKDPAARYESAAALADDLENFCADRAIRARPIGLASRCWRWSRRNLMLAGLSAATVVSLIALVATLLGILPRGPAAPALPEKSIAVLPFASFGDDKENAYLADGMQDEILTDLTKVADLKVISRRSAAQFRDTKQSVRAIGEALQVSHVMEGTVHKAAGRIHVTVQLIDTRTGTETWAEKYEREVADIYLIQSDIAQEIISRLKAELSPREKEAIEEKPTQDIAAYDLYLRARSLVYDSAGKTMKQGAEDANKAIELLEQATARDPNFALAYCVIADAQLTIATAEWSWGERWKNKAKEAIDAALRISPDSAEVHLARARYLIEGLDDPAAGEKDLAIAAAGLPGRAAVFNLRAVAEEQGGHWKEALRDLERGVELDPRESGPADELTRLLISLRRYPQAERLADHMIAILPKEPAGVFWRLKSYIPLARGDAKGAMAALDASPFRHVGLIMFNQLVANTLIMQRNYPKAEEFFQSVIGPGKIPYVVPSTEVAQLFLRGAAYESLGRLSRFRGEGDKASSYFEAARPYFEQWLAQDRGGRWGRGNASAYLAQIDAGLGRKDQAIREGRKVVEFWSAHDARVVPDTRIRLAIVYLWSGEREPALQELSEVVKVPAWTPAPPFCPGMSAGDLRLNPLWDELRDEPRFQKLIVEAAQPIEIK
jgi:TolB-like protein/Tfp pilus assembly protein PilF